MTNETFDSGVLEPMPPTTAKQAWMAELVTVKITFLWGWIVGCAAPAFIILYVWGFVPGLVALCVALGVLLMAVSAFYLVPIVVQGVRNGYIGS